METAIFPSLSSALRQSSLNVSCAHLKTASSKTDMANHPLKLFVVQSTVRNSDCQLDRMYIHHRKKFQTVRVFSTGLT